MKATLPRGIRRRGDSYMLDVVVDGRRVTRTKATLEEALAARDALKRGVPEPKTWTLQEAFETTVARAWAGAKAETSSVRNGRAIVGHFGADCRLDMIDIRAIEAFIETLEAKGSANATINRKLAALSKIMSVAHQRGGLYAKPHIPRRRENAGRIRWLTDQEEKDLIGWLNHLGLGDVSEAVVVLLDTGMRTGELWKLTQQDVTGGMIHIWDPKNATPRSVPMTDRVARIMGQRRGPRLFPYDNWWLNRGWSKARARMGLEDDPQFVPHALRHTCASRLVQRGVGLAVVQAWLGHKAITVTLRYAHLAPANLQAAKEVLEG